MPCGQERKKKRYKKKYKKGGHNRNMKGGKIKYENKSKTSLQKSKR